MGRQLLAPVFVDDVGRLAADALVADHARFQVLELGGPETVSMREIVRRAINAAGLPRPILPGPTLLLKVVAAPLTLLPEPPLSLDAIDFINQPATVDLRALMALLPRRLTRFDEGVRTYLPRDSGPGAVQIDGELGVRAPSPSSPGDSGRSALPGATRPLPGFEQ
jgi:nucleoside-diphosphate-sugar epimerase